MGTEKASPLPSLSRPATLISILYLASGVLGLWAFSLTRFREYTLVILALSGFAAVTGLWMKKQWGRWLALAIFVPHFVQAAILLWTYLLLSSGQLVANGVIIMLLLGVYLIILSVFTILLWRKPTTS